MFGNNIILLIANIEINLIVINICFCQTSKEEKKTEYY